jgi:hypothetical protein
MRLMGTIRHAETWIPIESEEEAAVVGALLHDRIPHLFAIGLVKTEMCDFHPDEIVGLIFHIRVGGKVLAALESLPSFKIPGSASQGMFAMARRLHATVVN